MPASRLATRAIVRLSPLDDAEDVGAFLQGLVTNDVTGALPVYAGLLTAQGKTLFDFLVWRDRRDFLLDCEADAAADLTRRLSLYRLRRKIGIAPDPTLAVHWTSEVHAGTVPDPRLAELGYRFLAPVSGDDDEAADDAWCAHRLASGVAEGQAELGDILWLETNAVELNGVTFDKGCYIGQENTARMNWRQKINRRLIVVPIALSDPKRCKAAYPKLGVAVDHLRVDDIAEAWRPAWLSGAV